MNSNQNNIKSDLRKRTIMTKDAREHTRRSFGSVKNDRVCPITVILVGVLFLSQLTGCESFGPFFYTDNPYLLCLPGAGRRSDLLPGYLRPSDRIKLIVEKGKKGEKASGAEKEVLLVQLAEEYEKAETPFIRRATLDAVARISVNYPNPVAEKIFHESLESEDLGMNLSACSAWSRYCSEGAVAESNKEQRRLAAEFLAERYRALPYSIAAGSEEENAYRKDVRIAILHALETFKPDDSPEVLNTLELGLTGEKLDDGALEATACRSLEKVTGRHYGLNSAAWQEYIAYSRGESSAAPAEPSFFARSPKLDNVTGVVK